MESCSGGDGSIVGTAPEKHIYVDTSDKRQNQYKHLHIYMTNIYI